MSTQPEIIEPPDARTAGDLEPGGGVAGGMMDERKWRYQVRGQRLAVLWLVCTIMGALAIHLSGARPIGRLVVPVAIMLFYVFYGYSRAQESSTPVLKTARVGQLADSLYFLGFIWTLWALIDSFVFQQMTAAEAVFRTFGYALVTTATGMFLRLMLLLFRYWGADQVDLGEQRLEEQIERFSVAVNRSIGAARGLEKAVQGVQAQANAHLEEVAKAAQASMDKLVAFTTTKIEPSLDALNQSIHAYARKVQETGDDLKSSAGEMSSSMRNAALEVSGSAGQMRKTVRDEAGKLCDEMEKALQQTQLQAGKSADHVAEAARTSINDIGATAAALKPALEEVASSARGYAKEARGASMQLREVSEEMVVSIRASAGRMGEAVEESRKSLENTRKAIDGVEESVRLVARKIEGIRVMPSVAEDAVRLKVKEVLLDLERAARVLGVSAEKLSGLGQPAYAPPRYPDPPQGVFNRLYAWFFGRRAR